MPLLITPYTFGSEMGVAGPAVVGGVAFYVRKKRYIAYIMSSIILALLLR